MIELVYLISLLFIIIFILYLFIISSKSPKKIELYYKITFLLLGIRYGALLICNIIDEQKFIYYIKSLVPINFIVIPLLGLSSLYIFLRDENRKFNYNYIFMVAISIIYVISIFIYKIDIKIDNIYGFIINFKQNLTPILIYLIMLSSIAVVSLLYVDKPYNNRVGMWMLMLSLLINIGELIMFLGGIKVFPYPIIGEVLILFTSYKAISTFK